MSSPKPKSDPPPATSRDDRESASAAPRRKRRRRRASSGKVAKPRVLISGAAKIAIACVLGALAAVSVGMLVVFPGTRGPGLGRVVELVVPGDESASALAARLETAGLVSHPDLFAAYARMTGAHRRVARGTHLVTDDLSVSELLHRLERSGGGEHAKVTIPEGFTRFDIAHRLYEKHVCGESAFLDATKDPELLREVHVDGETAEGFLFPATYELALDADPKEIVRRLKSEFDRRFGLLEQTHKMGEADLDQSLNWGVREIVTLASMIEKEAAVDDERPIIASVFLNRLRDPSFKHRVLQSDPTSAYGCLTLKDRIPACAGFTGKITHDINVDPQNIYSTYVHEGLPPGPISNPGVKSIAAVLSPAVTKYLYFVARGEGRHTFSETYEAHTTAVKHNTRSPSDAEQKDSP